MLKKLFFILIYISIITTFTNAQNQSKSASISGTLIDGETKEPISQANIRILAQKDSLFITGKASEKDGSFSIPIKSGSYIVQISYIGYTDMFRDTTVTSRDQIVNLDTIPLIDDGIILSDALITAKAPEIVIRGDTLEYNADSYKVGESAVIEDLLKKLPGVEVDNDGKIKVNGKEIKKILVDGKEFFSDDPKIASKNLPAKMVDKLQVVDKKSEMAEITGFDDGNEETIINLTVKPGMKKGVFGNVLVGYGSQDRYETNAMINYMRGNNQMTLLGGFNNTNNAGFSNFSSSMSGRRGMMMMGGNGITKSANAGVNFNKEPSDKIAVGGNIRYGDSNIYRESSTYTQNLLSAGNTFDRDHSTSNTYSQNVNMDLRVEWIPDSLTRFIFRPNASINSNNNRNNREYSTVDNEGDTINNGYSKYYSTGDSKNIGASLEGSRTLGKKGRVLSLNLSVSRSDAESNGNNLSETIYSSSQLNDTLNQFIKNTSNSNNIRFYASYVEPLGKNNFMQIAYNYSLNKSESDNDTRKQDEKGDYTILDTIYSKKTENDFTNQNLELNFRASREKYNYMFGIAMEPSDSENKTYKADSLKEDFTQKVINYAPIAQFNYLWNKQSNLYINYNGRTNQPSVNQLSSIEDISNPLNISKGNPDLKPSFNHRFSVSYQNFDYEKNRTYMLMTNGGFIVNDIVSSRTTNRETGQNISTYENVNGNWSANARFMTNQPFRNIKFTLHSTTFSSYNNSNGFSNGEKNTSKRLNIGENLGLNYRSDKFDFSLNGNISYNKVDNTLRGQQDQEYVNYGSGAHTTIYLPLDILIESDISYSTNSGYADGFEQKELLWNASISKQLFKEKNGTLKLKIYDILKQKSDLSRSVTSNYIRDTTTNTLTSYFMIHFVYRFNIFKGGSSSGRKSRGSRSSRMMGGNHGYF